MTYHSDLPDPTYQAAFYEGVTAKRLIAFGIDFAAILAMTLVLVPFTFFTAIFFFPVLMAIVGFFYRVLTIAGKSSTWGMRVMAIELRDRDGARFDGSKAALHTIGFYISFAVFPLQILSILLMLLSERRQGLTDHVLGSAMINRRAA